MSYRTASGQLVTIGQLLASGGEGDIFAVTSHRGTVLKKYKPAAGLLGTRPAAIGFGLLPVAIHEMFRKAFEDGATSPARRPTALAWNQALTGLAAGLKQCRSDPAHVYPPHLGGCPWCARPQAAIGKPATRPARPPWSFRR